MNIKQIGVLFLQYIFHTTLKNRKGHQAKITAAAERQGKMMIVLGFGLWVVGCELWIVVPVKYVLLSGILWGKRFKLLMGSSKKFSDIRQAIPFWG